MRIVIETDNNSFLQELRESESKGQFKIVNVEGESNNAQVSHRGTTAEGHPNESTVEKLDEYKQRM